MTRAKFIIKIKIHSSCEIECFVETHLCKLCVILRSRVLRVYMLSATGWFIGEYVSRLGLSYQLVIIRLMVVSRLSDSMDFYIYGLSI